jgi:selenocysteine lyase/cysteine desulfurase
MLALTFDQQLPKQLPKTLPIYGVAVPPSPTRDIEAIARSWPDLRLARAKVRRLDNWIAVDYGQLALIYQQVSGAVQAKVRVAGARVREGDIRFPVEDDKVVEMARAFLGRVSFVDDEVSKLALGKVTHLWRQYASSEGVGPPEILDAGVVFTRVIDETPVVGPGGHVMVKVLPHGAIGGAWRVFRQRGAKVATVRITPSGEALAKLEDRLRRYRHLDGTVRVLRAQFGYFEAGRSHRQRFFEPAYFFVYETEGLFPLKSAEVVQASG